MPLVIPKMVVLEDKWLSRLYYTMLFSTGAGMCIWFHASGGYMTSVGLREKTHLNMWVNMPSDAEFEQLVEDHMVDVCGRPRDYDYWYDQTWRYDGGNCINVSSACNLTTGTCLKAGDVQFKESPTQIFLTTFVQQTQTFITGQVHDWGTFYVPQAEGFTVNFEYFFTAPEMPMLASNKGVTKPPEGQEMRMTNAEVLTVYLDAQREIVSFAAPGEPLSLTVPELLALAGTPEILVTPNSAWGANVLPGATYEEGPVGLIGGVPLELHLHCHKKPKHRDHDKSEYKDWTGPTCYVIASAKQVWSTKYTVQMLSLVEGTFNSAHSGIRITGIMDGTWEYFDLNNCILNFTALLVLMGIPRSVVTWIACRTLGHLGAIYRRIIYERFSIAEQIAGMTARVVTHGTSFREIELHDKYGGVTLGSLYDTISHATRYRRPDPPEGQQEALGPSRSNLNSENSVVHGTSGGMKRMISPTETMSNASSGTMKRLQSPKDRVEDDDIHLFANFAFEAISDPKSIDRGRMPRFMQKIVKSKAFKVFEFVGTALFGEDFVSLASDAEHTITGEPRISIDHFLTAASTSEPVRFEDVMWLFSSHRKPGFLERLFTPSSLAKHINERHGVKDAVDKVNSSSSGVFGKASEDDHSSPHLEERDRELFVQVQTMTNDVKLSNRALIRQYVKNNTEVLNEVCKKNNTLTEDVRQVQEAHAEMLRSIESLQGHPVATTETSCPKHFVTAESEPGPLQVRGGAARRDGARSENGEFLDGPFEDGDIPPSRMQGRRPSPVSVPPAAPGPRFAGAPPQEEEGSGANRQQVMDLEDDLQSLIDKLRAIEGRRAAFGSVDYAAVKRKVAELDRMTCEMSRTMTPWSPDQRGFGAAI